MEQGPSGVGGYNECCLVKMVEVNEKKVELE